MRLKRYGSGSIALGERSGDKPAGTRATDYIMILRNAVAVRLQGEARRRVVVRAFRCRLLALLRHAEGPRQCPLMREDRPAFRRGYCLALHGVDPRNIGAPPALGHSVVQLPMVNAGRDTTGREHRELYTARLWPREVWLLMVGRCWFTFASVLKRIQNRLIDIEALLDAFGDSVPNNPVTREFTEKQLNDKIPDDQKGRPSSPRAAAKKYSTR